MNDPEQLRAALPKGFRERIVSIKLEGGIARAIVDVSGLGESEQRSFLQQLRQLLANQPGVDEVRVTATAERAEAAAEPPRAFRIVAIASGKGGVGKSTVAANLAVSLTRRGLRVGLLDADIHGPSAPTLLGTHQRAELNGGRIQPVNAHGVVFLSMGLMTDPDRAVAWRGPMASTAMAQMLSEADWGALDLLLIDMPPGTGDISLTLAQKIKPDGVVIVSTPQDLALIDARRALSLFRQLGTPVLGLIENMSMFVCPHCGEASAIFGAGGVDAAAAAESLPVLGRLPLDPAVRAASDAGEPDPGPEIDAAAVALLGALEERR